MYLPRSLSVGKQLINRPINGTQFLNCHGHLPKIWTISLVNKQLECFLSSLSSLQKLYESGFRAKHSIISATSWVINDIVSAALINISTLLHWLSIRLRILKQRIISCCNQNCHWQESVCYDWRCEILVFSYFQGRSLFFCLGPHIVYAVYWRCCKVLGSPGPSSHR